MEEGEHIEIRMGINLGDVIIENEDIFGDGVNIAARLEAMAEPEEICITSRIYDLIAGRFDVGLEDLGAQKLKNIANLIVAYNVVLDSNQIVSPAALVADDLPLPDKPSIAVIPFDNLSGDPEQEYFSDGMILIAETARVICFHSSTHDYSVRARIRMTQHDDHGLIVAAANSSASYPSLSRCHIAPRARFNEYIFCMAALQITVANFQPGTASHSVTLANTHGPTLNGQHSMA